MNAIDIAQFKALATAGAIIIDTRTPEIFCDGFIEDSLSIPFNEGFISTLEELVTAEQKILLVTDAEQTNAVLKALKDSGNTSVEGYLTGGFEAWQNAGNKIDMLITVDADEFAIDYKFDEFYLIDVRPKEEFEKEHAEDAENIVLHDLEQILIDFETTDSYYVYGSTLQEAVTAGSVFRKIGFTRVRVVAADFETVKATGIPWFKQKKKTDSSSK
jgi:rhodanese-related sulfurtransferase